MLLNHLSQQLLEPPQNQFEIWKFEVKRTMAVDCNLIIHGVKDTMIKTKEEINHDDKDRHWMQNERDGN